MSDEGGHADYSETVRYPRRYLELDILGAVK